MEISDEPPRRSFPRGGYGVKPNSPRGLRIEGLAVRWDPMTLKQKSGDGPVISFREASWRMERHPGADVSVEIRGRREPLQGVRPDQGRNHAGKGEAALRIGLRAVAICLPAILMGGRPGRPPFIG